jgi:putative addiction module antidote
MAIETKVRRIGNSLGIILPKEALETLKVQEGASLYLTEAPNQTMQVTAGQSDFARTMEVAERCMDRYRNALRELAK